MLRAMFRVPRFRPNPVLLALVLGVALASSTSAMGPLWLLGDDDLEVNGVVVNGVETNGVEANWVAPVFGQIVTEAQVSITPDPTVLVLYADGGGLLLYDLEKAFENAGIVVPAHFHAAKLQDVAIVSGGRSRAAAEVSIASADILVLMDGTTPSYFAQLSQAKRDAIVAHVAGGGVLVAQGRAASLMGSLVLKQTDSVMGDVSPYDALANAYDPGLQLEPGPFGFLPKSLIEVNFLDEGRIARLPVVLARANQQAEKPLLGIGIDDSTALRVKLSSRTDNAYAEVVGGGSVTLQHARACGTEIDLEPGLIGGVPDTTPHITGLVHHQLTEGYEFEVTSKQITVRPDWEWVPGPFVEGDAVNFTANLPLNGSKPSYPYLGSVYYEDVFIEPKAILFGEVEFTAGEDVFQNTVHGTKLFGGSDGGQATKVGVNMLALADQPGRTALLLPSKAKALPQSPSTVKNIGSPSFLALDSYGVSGVAYSDYQEGNSDSPRQSVALVGAHIHVIGKGGSVDLHDFRECDSMLPGDVDCDGKVNVVDVQHVIKNSLEGVPAEPVGSFGDLSCDGSVDINDVMIAIDYALEAM
ncbi:dockerin type I domain-containing protein [Myxococcota bacterium]|nr:dockerin type I domain-containing protein [Myxococcota bacterium]